MSVPAAGADVRVVLLAGGRGSRFWPVSRASRPKPFLRLFGDRTLLRFTFERMRRVAPADRIHAVTHESYAPLVRAEIPELPGENLLLEPSGKDTAPAVALATREMGRHGADTVLVFAPTDHYVSDETAFVAAIGEGVRAASAGSLVTFGVVPDRPATGYGYIETDRAGQGGGGALRVLRFREKPPAREAEAFLAAGNFFWNSGLFACRIDVLEQELAAAAPELVRSISRLPARAPGASPDPSFARAWADLPAASIDYALLEKASSLSCVPLKAGWSDVGGWDAVHEMGRRDASGNLVVPGVLYVDSRDSMVARAGAHEESDESGPDRPGPKRTAARERLYALVGVDGIYVIETEDAVLICRKGAGESLREVALRLHESEREDLL